MRQGVVFDSRISKRATEEDLRVNFKITEAELDMVTKLYQAFKISKITTAPTIEMFLKSLVFENMDYLKEKCKYNEIYKEK
jgi:hypothetical protein